MFWRTARRLAAGLGTLAAAGSHLWLILAVVAGVLALALAVVVLMGVLGTDKRREAALNMIKVILGRSG